MSRVPSPRTTLRRTVLFSLVTALLAAAVLGALAPRAVAAPIAPYFGANMQVDRSPAYSGTTPALAVGSDGVAYLAFSGWGGSTANDVFFTKSTDGRTWTVPFRVNFNDASAREQTEPAIALDASNNIVMVWTDQRNGGNNDIYFAKSTDGGLSFSSNVRVNDVAAPSQTEPDVAVDHANPNLIHVVWTDNRNGAPDIYYANSTDGGLSFNPSQRVNNDGAGGAEQSQPAVEVAPNRDVYAIWTDGRGGLSSGQDIYFAKSANLGGTWNPNIRLNDDPTTLNVAQRDPTLAVDSTGTIYAAWADNRNANTGSDIYAARSTNGGAGFTSNVRVNDDTTAAAQNTPSLATNAGTVELAWTDTRTTGSTNWDVYAASSSDGLTWNSAPNARVNDDNLNAFQVLPTVGVDASQDVFIAWLDTRGPTGDIYASVLDRVAPVASAGSPTSANQGASVSFDAAGSTDNFGIATSSWDFGDGTSAVGLAPTHAYQNPGVYTATVTVWDASGNSAMATRVVTVRDTVSPIVRGGGDRAVEEGQPLFFDGSASSDNVGVLGYAWDFGDGSTSDTATATHVYGRPGTYTAKLTVTDAAGNAATSSFAVSVRPNADLALIQLLGGLVGVLAIVIGLLGWMLVRIRKKDRERGVPAGAPPNPGNPIPPPPRDSDPIEMTFPPNQPPRAP